jgi:hypothetical protein
MRNRDLRAQRLAKEEQRRAWNEPGDEDLDLDFCQHGNPIGECRVCGKPELPQGVVAQFTPAPGC